MKENDLDKVLNYMKQYVENKYEHDSEPMLTYKDLQLVLEEIERLNKAFKDIQTILIKKQKAKGLCNQILNVQEERCLDIVNKALGSDKE